MTDTEKKAVVRYLSLVRKEGGEPIVGIPYREMSVDPDLVASFVLAVIIFENRQLKSFVKEGYSVVIEEGEHVVGLLIVDRIEDDTPFRTSLLKIIDQFEGKYAAQMHAWKGDIRPFREFALNILAVFPFRTFSYDFVPRITKKSDANPDNQAEIPWSVGQTNEKLQTVLGYINGKRSITEILDQSDLDDAEIIAILSLLDRYKWIALTRRLANDSILVKIMEPPMFLKGVYGEQLEQLVNLCDGTRTLDEMIKALPFNEEATKTVARNLIDGGVLGFLQSKRDPSPPRMEE